MQHALFRLRQRQQYEFNSVVSFIVFGEKKYQKLKLTINKKSRDVFHYCELQLHKKKFHKEHGRFN